jgi:hypothetical protein
MMTMDDDRMKHLDSLTLIIIVCSKIEPEFDKFLSNIFQYLKDASKKIRNISLPKFLKKNKIFLRFIFFKWNDFL